MRLAAIDIGSNAIRILIAKPTDNLEEPFKKLEFIRFPLRLGDDVFETGIISRQKEEKFIKVMQTFHNLLDIYEVDYYLAYATSAMRESQNGRQIVKRVYYQFGIQIDIIDGDAEASTISLAIQNYLNGKNYLHIDVGGGSTELNLYIKKNKVAARSFKLGSVRGLHPMNMQEAYDKISLWLQKHLEEIEGVPLHAIGTGGNINKIFDLALQKDGIWIHYDEILRVRNMIAQYSLDDRKNILQLNDDRADVILPAADIYLYTMQKANIQSMIVPKVGLREGMILQLIQQLKKQKLISFS
ncbi:MAG: phosphatase [Flammeovirgaceae bacterium]|nr:phosphatase [Flammeovirgaceae bacterium]MDW8288318.1 phosphatase [Flammeovirgaceae bacterium]